jgi:iron complex outermembrane receptor protein
MKIEVSVPAITARRRGRAYRYAGFFGVALSALVPAATRAQDGATPLPPVQIEAPKQRPAQKQTSVAAKRAARRRAVRSAQAPKPATQTAAVPDDGNGPNNNTSGPPLQQAPSLGKTGTKLADIPASVQIVPRTVVTEQGGTLLRDAIWNASGINSGGQDSLGYFDHFLIRGLNAQVFTDRFNDGDQLGGLVHSLNGVKQIEILEGPGSALFGSGAPGGTINIVHYDPSPVFHWGASTQVNSFGGVTNNEYVTGPTSITGLNYRIDATVAGGGAFRDLNSKDYEIRPEFQWHVNDHTLTFALDARHIEQTPDSYGLIYFGGQPISGVPNTAKYSTPFVFARQDVLRPTFTDQWDVTDFLTINNRLSYTHREIDAMRNNDSMTAINSASGTHLQTNPDGTISLAGRQLRYQNDSDNYLDYQLEPVWKFYTGGVHHTLLTGFEYQRQDMSTFRETADLFPIANVFAPTPAELSTAQMKTGFLCDKSHSCDNDHLMANYYGLYATDQMDLTDKWKLRMGVRQDWFDTELNPLITVPGAFTLTNVPIVAGVQQSHNEQPLSWNVGTLYHVTNWMAPYIGASQSYLANFNSENVQNGIGAPESARQYEAGIRFTFLNERIVFNTAVFNTSRDDVATLFTPSTGPSAGVQIVTFDSQLTNGEEASLIAKITDQWSILANATHQEAVVTIAPNAPATIGNIPQGVPANMANVWTTYKFAIGGISGFQAGIGANYRDRTWSDTTNVNSVPGFVIGNLMVGWEDPNWGVALNVKNFTNKLYFVAANGAGGFVGEGLGAYLTVRYHQ